MTACRKLTKYVMTSRAAKHLLNCVDHFWNNLISQSLTIFREKIHMSSFNVSGYMDTMQLYPSIQVLRSNFITIFSFYLSVFEYLSKQHKMSEL